MAKTNNLTDFLTGLADKFRSKLGGTALINPQNFESKIDEVYQKGYDDAPKGVDTSDATAAADDVQNGKTFYAGGVKKTGSLNVTAGLVDSAVTVVDEPRNNRIYAQNAGISQKAIYNKNTKTKLLIPYEKAISAIGLTADKIVSGNTILGVNGTATTGVPNTIEVGHNQYSENGNGAITLTSDSALPFLFVAKAILPNGMGSPESPGFVTAALSASWDSMESGSFVELQSGTNDTIEFSFDSQTKKLLVVDTGYGLPCLIGEYAVIYHSL